MSQTLPSPARSAARAQAATWRGAAAPGNAAPRNATRGLSVKLEPIALAQHAEQRVEVVAGGRHLGEPRARGAGVLEAARGEDQHDRLLWVHGLPRDELHHRGERRGRGGLDEHALLARERALRLEDALVGDLHAEPARLPERGEALPGAVARRDRAGDGAL